MIIVDIIDIDNIISLYIYIYISQNISYLGERIEESGIGGYLARIGKEKRRIVKE